MSVQLLRNTRLWVSTSANVAGITPDNTWEVLIQDDFSFNQEGNSTDVNLNEAGPKPTRGSRRFNDSLNPADWNFSTYLRPYTKGTSAAARVLTPDYALWHSLASGSPLNIENSLRQGVTSNPTNMMVSFTDNQYHELNKLTLYYLVDNVWYAIHEVQIGQAEVNVDIDGIGMVTWTGQGTRIEPMGSIPPFAHTTADYTFPDVIFETASWIKNKLTTLRVRDNEHNNPDGSPKEYTIPVTGASVTINNNITYLTPNTLSRLDVPIGSFTGTFEVTGTLEAYLRDRDPGDTATTNFAAELLNRMINDRSITNSFEIAICMGGEYTSAAPGVVLVMKQAHLSVPSTETADVLGTTIEFKGQPTELDAGDEIFLGFSDKYTKTLIDRLVKYGDAAITTVPAPTITTQPANQTITVGENLQLTVAGTNIARTQWYKAGVAIPRADELQYNVPVAKASDAGTYYVEVYNSDGAKVKSTEITVTIS